MKKIVGLVLLLLPFMVQAQIQIDANGQVQATGNFAPNLSGRAKGGLIKVKTIVQRNSLPLYIKDTGMICYVNDSVKGYFLKASGVFKAVTDITDWLDLGTVVRKINDSTLLVGGDTIKTGGATNSGAQGPQGIQGLQGPQGIQGLKGDKGDIGNTGAQGTQGLSGAQGITGATGATGAQGIQGVQGQVGAPFAIYESFTSVSALLADTGNPPQTFSIVLTGNSNDADDSKLYYWSGTAWSYITKLSGATGIAGPTGATGAQGIKGDKGDPGAQGISGTVGAQGVQGIKGDKGDNGTAGPQGLQGIAGATGAQGVAGPIGATGPAGQKGDKGDPGSDGTYTPYVLDTTIAGTGTTTVFNIPLPSLSTYSLGNVRGYGDYKDSLSGTTLIIIFAVAPVGNVRFKISGTYGSSSVSVQKPKFGVLVNTSSTANDNTAVNNLGLSRVRSAYAQGGGTPQYVPFSNTGYKVVETYNYAVPVSGNAIQFQTDTAAFRSTMQAFMTNNPQQNIEGFCMVNEENNWGYTNAYWSGNASQYLRLLNIGIDEAHKSGKWASNGGLTGQYLSFKVWEDYTSRGYTDSAESYRIASGLASTVSTFRSNSSRQPQIYFLDTLIAAYATNNMDYVNFHIYVQDTALDTPLVLRADVAYLRRVTGKPVITNEYGIQVAGAASQLVALTKAGVDVKMDYMIGYSGNQTYTWVNTDGSLTPVGQAYKNYINSL